MNGLSRRQNEVLRWAATGLSNRNIAVLAGCSEKAVERALEECYEKCGLKGDDDWNPRVRAVCIWLGVNL